MADTSIDPTKFAAAFTLMKQPALCFLSTLSADGTPETRAMINLWNENNFDRSNGLLQDGDFTTYLTTHASTAKVAQILSDPHGGVYFQDGMNGVFIGGTLEIVQSDAIKQTAWKAGFNWDIQFEDGPADPEYTLIKLTACYVKLYYELEQTTFDIQKGCLP